MKTALARKLIADLQECTMLYPYNDITGEEPPIPHLLAARVTSVRLDAVTWLWDVVLLTPEAADCTAKPPAVESGLQP